MSLALMVVLTGIAGYLGPWWGMAVVALLVGACRAGSAWGAFVVGALGVGFWWLALPLYTHLASAGVLTARLAIMAKMPAPSLLLLFTVLIGGLLGGLAALAGYQSRMLVLAFWPQRKL